MAEDFNQTRIEMLRRRWEQTASPHVSLQLADLYRQKGELELAVETLSKGMEGNPESVSLRVALGRYQMESGRHEDAVGTLGVVVEGDPSHLVANKLLVKAYVHLGRKAEARDRLDLYRLINESDPEIDVLERSVEAGQPLFAPGQVARAAKPATTVGDSAVNRTMPGDVPEVGTASNGRSVHVVWQGGEPFALAGAATDDLAAMAEEGIFFQGVDFPAAADEASDAVDDGATTAPTPAGLGQSATMTLGRLYLAQGHHAEAAEVFRSILATDPGRPEAREALAEAEAALAGGVPVPTEGKAPEEPVKDTVSPEAMQAAAAGEPQPAAPADTPDPEEQQLVRRKIGALRAYLERLGRNRARTEI